MNTITMKTLLFILAGCIVLGVGYWVVTDMDKHAREEETRIQDEIQEAKEERERKIQQADAERKAESERQKLQAEIDALKKAQQNTPRYSAPQNNSVRCMWIGSVWTCH